MNIVRSLHWLISSPIAPFHDDAHLQRLVLDTVQRHGIQTFVETGTFRGDSVSWVGQNCPQLRLVSVESSWLFHAWARARQQHRRRSQLIHGDSRSALRQIIQDAPHPILFWLDAHWEDDLPLEDELNVIRASCSHAVIFIDDFRVPGREDFGYDSYHGQDIGMDIVNRAFSGAGQEVHVLVPDYSPRESDRGYAVIYLDVEPATAQVGSLKAVSLAS